MAPSTELEFPHAADLPRARVAIAETCARMHARGYIVAGDGNVSTRVGRDKLLITPSGGRKGYLSPDAMVLCDLAGQPLRGERGRPSAEIAMHVAVYQARPEVTAVVHAHPPIAVAHTIAGVSLAEPLMPEAYCALGEVITVPYTIPTTGEVPRAIAHVLRDHHAMLLERHGSLTFGRTLAEAYDRLEVLEHTARIALLARVLAPGQVRGLSAEQLAGLQIYLGCGLPT
ncbi:MAG: class II aldolase/adducin family protein [Deltaproteobacteria bacterium]|nr:class II aldolase/adducin family protein [Deltaproteobacteria bacterium]